MNQYPENISLGELFNLIPESYRNMEISKLPFSTRIINRLYRQNIKTVESLLKVDIAYLTKIDGFGKACLEQVYRTLENIPQSNTVSIVNSVVPAHNAIDPTVNKKCKFSAEHTIALTYKSQILSGNYSFIEYDELGPKEKKQLLKYEEAFNTLGKDLTEKCIHDTSYVLSLMRMLERFRIRNENYDDLRALVDGIPQIRRQNKCKFYISAYTSNEALQKRLKDCYSSENAPLYSIIDTINYENKLLLDEATKFIKWCYYNISDQITKLFNNLYANERRKTVIEARANCLTLNDVGDLLCITRERVRQIEKKAKSFFVNSQSKLKIVAKIYADKNGNNIITYEDIVEVSGDNAKALVYLLKISESSFYTYDDNLDAFVIGNVDISSRIHSYIDSLPDIFRKNEMQDILALAKEQKDLDFKYVEKAIFASYKLSGDVYHRKRLTLSKIYDNVLRVHYPNGIHIYDDNQLSEFRKLIINEYGDVGLPATNRAIIARISSIGVLFGRGTYIAKRKQWMPRALENNLLNYIKKSNTPILLIGSIFYEFEDDLIKAGIDNRYFLQGVLKDLFGDQFYFRRDYITKDKNFTSIYSSIISYIEEKKYPVKKEELKSKFQGVTDIVITIATNDNSILNYFGEYIHSSHLVIYENEKTSLYNQLINILNDNTARHIKDIYPDLLKNNEIVFTRNAANSTFCAYSVLEFLFRNQFQFSRPYIAKKGIEIGRPAERLHEMIYQEEEFLISEIRDFAKDNHFQITSMIEYLNSLNDKYMIRDIDTMASIDSMGVSEGITKEVEEIISEDLSVTTPIRNLICFGKFPKINVNWSEWIVYSCLNKWGKKLDVELSSGQYKFSIPLVSPKGKMDISMFNNVMIKPVKIKIDDMDDIDDLLSDIITEDMLEDI